MITAAVFLLALPQAEMVRVETADGLRAALAAAKPGTQILVEPGTYPGGQQFSDIVGRSDAPIVIRASDPDNPPKIVGGTSGWQFSRVSYLELQDLTFEKQTGNGVNVDDGGDYKSPSVGVRLINLEVKDLPEGNHDAIKLSGVKEFLVKGCTISRWGGSGVDMVGCHSGLIRACLFRDGGSNAVQIKGGSSRIVVDDCRFEDAGERGVNIGGSTGFQFFRPPVDSWPEGSRSEAKDISVRGCTFIGGTTAVAFVGVDRASFTNNTIYHPERWALRILQETRGSGFVPSREGEVLRNLIVFRSDQWQGGGINVGDGTAPKTFRFRDNWWYCSDKPQRSRPQLPTEEFRGIYGKDPMLSNPKTGDFSVDPSSEPSRYGACSYPIGRSYLPPGPRSFVMGAE